MIAVLAGLGWLFGGPTGVAWSLALTGLLAALTPSPSPARLMRANGARPLSPFEVPALQAAVRDLARDAGLSRPPTLYLVPLPGPQAFATERGGERAIGISPALLQTLSLREAVAVIAHEMSHLRHRDLWVMRLAETVRRLTGSMSTIGWLLLLISLPLVLVSEVGVPWLAIAGLAVAPRLVSMLALALSRSRELDADVGAVALTGDPWGLASALMKIEDAHRGPWWARLFTFELPESLRTHPSTRERVARLEEMARAGRRRVVEPIWRRQRAA